MTITLSIDPRNGNEQLRNATMAMTSLTSSELEALAAQCRNASFRDALSESPLWNSVAKTLRSCLDALDAAFSRSGRHRDADSNTNGGSAEEDDDDGFSYSFKVRKGAPMDELAASDGVAVHVSDVATALVVVEQATAAFRFLRNACAASPSNQDACREHELLPIAHDLVMRCCLWSDIDEPPVATAVVLLAQVALQFSVNAITGRTASQDVVWSLYFPNDGFQKIMVECQEHRKVVAFTAALQLNCVNKTLDDEGVSRRRVELVEARNLIITLLQRCLVNPTGDRNLSSAGAGRPVMDDQDPAFEWLCLVFKTLFEAGFSKHLYNAVGAHLLSKLWSRVTPEQLILLRMFTMWMTSHRDDATSRAPGESLPSGKKPTHGVPLHDEESFEVVFEFVTKTWASIVSQETEDRPEEADAMRKQVWIELENEAKLLLLDVMGELTLTRVAPSPSRRELAESLLQSLLSELQHVWSLRRLGAPAPPRSGAAAATPAALPVTEPLGYRSAIIRVVGNLTYRHTDHQDLVRDGGFLPLFLNHCNIDESNPLLREWSLVALRNLCEGNAANQTYINELRPQGIDRASVNLDAMNVDATLGDDGKLKVTRKPLTEE